MRNYIWRAIAPNEESIAHGAKFTCAVDRGGHSGAIWEFRDEQDTIRWRYGIRRNVTGRTARNPFNKADFVVTGRDNDQEVIIRRASFIPPAFNVIESGKVIGSIRMRSIFRNKYSVFIDGVNSWTFRMPLYTIRFYGESNDGAEVWVVLGPSKMVWHVLIKPGVKVWPLLAALAFIHNEWWNYG